LAGDVAVVGGLLLRVWHWGGGVCDAPGWGTSGPHGLSDGPPRPRRTCGAATSSPSPSRWPHPGTSPQDPRDLHRRGSRAFSMIAVCRSKPTCEHDNIPDCILSALSRRNAASLAACPSVFLLWRETCLPALVQGGKPKPLCFARECPHNHSAATPFSHSHPPGGEGGGALSVSVDNGEGRRGGVPPTVPRPRHRASANVPPDCRALVARIICGRKRRSTVLAILVPAGDETPPLLHNCFQPRRHSTPFPSPALCLRWNWNPDTLSTVPPNSPCQGNSLAWPFHAGFIFLRGG